MALLSLDMIREIRVVADAYTARERERLVTPAAHRTSDVRSGEANRVEANTNTGR